MKAFLQRRDRVQKITAPRCETPSENRVGGVGSVKYPGPFLFGGNVGIEQFDAAIELANHLPYQHGLPLRAFARIKMTLVFHCMLQNDPFPQPTVRASGYFRKESQESRQTVGREALTLKELNSGPEIVLSANNRSGT
jgi:hypothetical protein